MDIVTQANMCEAAFSVLEMPYSALPELTLKTIIEHTDTDKWMHFMDVFERTATFVVEKVAFECMMKLGV